MLIYFLTSTSIDAVLVNMYNINFCSGKSEKIKGLGTDHKFIKKKKKKKILTKTLLMTSSWMKMLSLGGLHVIMWKIKIASKT